MHTTDYLRNEARQTQRRRWSAVAVLLWPIAVLIPLSLSFCSGPEIANFGSEGRLKSENEQLQISEYHESAFVPITRSRYTYKEMPALFESMRQASDGYCEIIHHKKGFNKASVDRLIASDHFREFWGDRYWGSFHNLLAGCWNFYIMNDVKPFDDFRLIRSLYPDGAKHCYSVGLMQPYIMHNILDCKDLHFLDVDWRIHYAHFQLEEMFRTGRFEDRSSTIKAIQDLHLGWIAFSPTPPVARHQVDPSTLCRLDQEECLRNLVAYQKNREKLQAITWNLSALHDAQFVPHKGMPVIYLSNAIEELYTSKKQFQRLLDRVTESISIGQKALFAYHAAGTDEIGLYLLTRTEPAAPDASNAQTNPEDHSTYRVETICRDLYHRKNTGVLLPYETYFEKISATKAPPRCAAKIRALQSANAQN